MQVAIKGKEIVFHFRIETFPWGDESDQMDTMGEFARIYNLKKEIENYDKDWELIQIFTPSDKAKSIQVLYRKRCSRNY